MVITTIGFDADDTLWHSENHFAVTEARFQELLEPWLSPDETAERLLERERSNLRIFGYGIKGFTLSMVETAIEASGREVSATAIEQIIEWGKEMLDHPVDLLPGVVDTLDQLAGSYRLALITKGDLFHQESKVAESGLAERFEVVEILSEKAPANYQRVLDRMVVTPDEFLMVGNSVRSDVLPVLELGANAVHVPYHVTWGHEHVDCERVGWTELASISELPGLLKQFSVG
jgi:putative hydrolase of the HAD superfamily